MNNLTEQIIALRSLKNLGLEPAFFDTLADKILASGGLTVNLQGLEPEGKKYIVSIPNHEYKFTDLSHEGIKKALIKYVYYKQELLQRDGYFIGAWIEGQYLYLDISEGFSFRYKETAIVGLCKERGQKAFFDFLNKKTVYI